MTLYTKAYLVAFQFWIPPISNFFNLVLVLGWWVAYSFSCTEGKHSVFCIVLITGYWLINWWT